MLYVNSRDLTLLGHPCAHNRVTTLHFRTLQRDLSVETTTMKSSHPPIARLLYEIQVNRIATNTRES
jgi:hypothetical protein